MSTRMSHSTADGTARRGLRTAQHTPWSTYTQHTMRTVTQGIADTPYRMHAMGHPEMTSRDDMLDGSDDDSEIHIPR